MQWFDRITEEFVISAWQNGACVRTWMRDRLASACGIARSAVEHEDVGATYAEVRGCRGAGEVLYAVEMTANGLNVVKTVRATSHFQ